MESIAGHRGGQRGGREGHVGTEAERGRAGVIQRWSECCGTPLFMIKLSYRKSKEFQRLLAVWGSSRVTR